MKLKKNNIAKNVYIEEYGILQGDLKFEKQNKSLKDRTINRILQILTLAVLKFNTNKSITLQTKCQDCVFTLSFQQNISQN